MIEWFVTVIQNARHYNYTGTKDCSKSPLQLGFGNSKWLGPYFQLGELFSGILEILEKSPISIGYSKSIHRNTFVIDLYELHQKLGWT